MTPGDTAPEAPLRVEINGCARSCWSCTPTDVTALVIGYLHTSGYIDSLNELLSLELLTEPAGCVSARARVPALHFERVQQREQHEREHGCGLLHHVLCESAPLRAASDTPSAMNQASLPAAGELRPAFRELFARTKALYPNGGMHAAAIYAHSELVLIGYDVGRHNAVDSAIGQALQRNLDLSAAGLLLSARVSGAIALKAARAKLGWVASRSIPTTLACTLANTLGLPLIARAGRDEQ